MFMCGTAGPRSCQGELGRKAQLSIRHCECCTCVETASLESCGSDESKLRHPACMARAQGKRTVKTNHFCLKVKVTVGPEVKMKEQCP